MVLEVTTKARPKICKKNVYWTITFPFGSLIPPPARLRGFVCIVADTLRVHYAGVAQASGRTLGVAGEGETVRGVNRKRATCAKWKWTKYRCKHSTVRVSIYDAPSYTSPTSWSSLKLYYDHTHMDPRGPPFVVYMPPLSLVSPHPHTCATFCSKILRSFESIRSPQNIVSYFSCTLWRL